MNNFTQDTLKPIQNSSVSFDYNNNNTLDKLSFVPQPKPQIKTKTIQLPELEFNPQYNDIHKLISDGNLQTQIKENYENINYVPISSSGYRGYSGLNSRKNGIKKTFRDASTEISTQFNSMEISTQSTPIKAQKLSEILKDDKYSTPLSETPNKGPFDTSDKIERSPQSNIFDSDSGSNYTPSPAKEQGSKEGRGEIFKKLNKVRQQALQTKESSRSGVRAYVRQRGTGFMPGAFKTPPTIKEEDERS